MARHASDHSRRLSKSDLRLSRFLGTMVLVVAGAAVYVLSFSSFEVEIGGYVPADGQGIICPSPWSVLFGEPEFEGVLAESRDSRVITRELCIRPSRTLVIEGAVIASLTVPWGLWLLSRRTMSRALPLLPTRSDD